MEEGSETAHRPLCTVELIAAGHATRCPGDACAFWDDGCVLARVEFELDDRPEVAALLVELRRALEAGQAVEVAQARTTLAGILDEADGIDEPL